MRENWIFTDRIVNIVKEVLKTCSEKYNIDILSIVLYGSKARGDRNSQNDYEFVVLLRDSGCMAISEVQHNDQVGNITSYIKFNNTVRLELIKRKIFQTKILTYTPEIFEDLLYNDDFVGTFLYMLCKENVIIIDSDSIFARIRDGISKNNKKNEAIFINQCIEFAKSLGSDKWAQKWEKILMQHNYLKGRKYC